MEQLAQIEARLHGIEELGELVNALRSMAAARAREAQDAFEGTSAYAAIIERAMNEIACIAEAPPIGPDDPSPTGARVLLAITSENGFVGGFNSRLIGHVCDVREKGERLIIVGRRGEITASERRVRPQFALAMTSRPKGVTALARRIVAHLKGVSSWRIVFTRYRSGTGFEVTIRSRVSLGSRGPADLSKPPPLHHLPPVELLAALSEEHLFAEVAHALMESLASENSARLQTMDAASRNVSDKLDKLRRQERAARQEETTSDMIDVVTGAEAVNGR